MDETGAERYHARRWATLAVLCLSVLIVVVDNTIVNVALPTLVRDLHASTTSLQWVVDAYTLTLAGLLVTFGSLGDRFGRHRFLGGGLLIFALGSALAAFSNSSDQLIASRVVMGVGAAAVMPTTLSILTFVFVDAHERVKAIALWSAVTGLGVAVGPTLGGWLLTHYTWSSIFVVNLPIVAIAVVAGHFLVPKTQVVNTHALDLLGAALLALSLVSIVYSIIEAPNSGWLSSRTIFAFCVGLVVMVWWIIWELRNVHPMVDLHIFTNARFAVASFAITMIFLALFGWLFLFTQQLQFVMGYTPLQAGVRALPFALGIGLASPIAVALTVRVGTKVVVVLGLIVMALGFVMVSTSAITTSFAFLVSASVVVAVGMGLAITPATESIMGSLPSAQSGVGSAMNDTTRELGGALGVAVMGSITATIFKSQLRLGALPAIDAASARSSLGAAVTIGSRATPDIGGPLVRSARHAFLIGADRATLVAAFAALVGAAVSAIYLPARASHWSRPSNFRYGSPDRGVADVLLSDN